MIKLIATDMDGTLLDDNKQLPKNFDNIVKRLFNKNIRFVISSGNTETERSFPLSTTYAPLSQINVMSSRYSENCFFSVQ